MVFKESVSLQGTGNMVLKNKTELHDLSLKAER